MTLTVSTYSFSSPEPPTKKMPWEIFWIPEETGTIWWSYPCLMIASLYIFLKKAFLDRQIHIEQESFRVNTIESLYVFKKKRLVRKGKFGRNAPPLWWWGVEVATPVDDNWQVRNWSNLYWEILFCTISLICDAIWWTSKQQLWCKNKFIFISLPTF